MMYSSSRPGRNRRGSKLHRSPAAAHSKAFLALSALLVLVFATGGASRADVESLPVLRPAATAFLFLGLYWLNGEHLRAHRFLLLWGGACAALVLAQLIPLPPPMWQGLSGRDLIVQIDQAVGLGDHWRPLTMTTAATRNAFWSLMPPLACLVLSVQLEPAEHKKVLLLVLALGLTSGVMGMLQLLGDPKGLLYLYDVTGHGQAVGLYANRNHQALLLAAMLPLLAVWALTRDGANSARLRALVATGAGAFVIPLLLITGSRAGLIMGSVGLVLAGVIIAATRRHRAGQSAPGLTPPSGARAKARYKRISTPAVLGLILSGAAALVVITTALSRDLAIERMLERDIAEDGRAKAMPTILEITQLHYVFGSGMGSFEQLYQVHEPDALLGPTYMNHAHNDWLELVQSGGIAALALLVAAIAWAGRQVVRYSASKGVPGDLRRLGQTGASFLVLAGLGSIGDYPLRTPSLACLMIVALVWTGNMARPSANAQAVQD